MSRIAALLTTVALTGTTLCTASTVPLVQRPWSGAAECRIEVQGQGYRDQQTHTWTLAGGTPSGAGAIQVHPAVWSISGGGEFERNQGSQRLIGQWKTTGQASAPFAMFVRASDGKLILKPWHSQLRIPNAIRGSQQQTIDGKPQKPVPIGLEAFEWTFPLIEVDARSKRISGQSAPAVTGKVSPMQPAGSVASCRCSWDFK